MNHSLYRAIFVFLMPNAAFAAAAVMIDAKTLVAVFNSAMGSLACGVCVAYFPTIRNFLGSYRKIDRADLLALGIFFAWFAIVLRTGWAIAWRYNGYNLDWTDSYFQSYYIFLSICAAIFHLAAPGAIESRIPTIEWVKIGLLVAIGIGGMLFASWMLGSATPL
jgi:hypothetical protein